MGERPTTASAILWRIWSALPFRQLSSAVHMGQGSMFFLPNMLLSGFIFPFLGMPVWAQWFSEWLPLTHYTRIFRSIMLNAEAVKTQAQTKDQSQ